MSRTERKSVSRARTLILVRHARTGSGRSVSAASIRSAAQPARDWRSFRN